MARAPLRVLLAPNASPMTLDGTRTFLVGTRRVAIIDPGPAVSPHLAAIADAVRGASCTILLTHGHPDHAAGAPALAERAGCRVRSFEAGTLADGDVIDTDAGALIALHTPGHTEDHLSFHWPSEAALFCGDLMMGGLDTALVAPPEGELGAYLASLERIHALRPRVIHPTHGPAITDPDAAIGRYLRHREEREDQVLRALDSAALSEDAVVDAVYGDALHPGLREAALGSVRSYLLHLQEQGRVRALASGGWARSEAPRRG